MTRWATAGDPPATEPGRSRSGCRDAQCLRSREIAVAALSAEGYLKTFEYDAVGQQIKVTEFDNRTVPTPAGEAPLAGAGPSRVTLATYGRNGARSPRPARWASRPLRIRRGRQPDRPGSRPTARRRPPAPKFATTPPTASPTPSMPWASSRTRSRRVGNARVHEAFGTAACASPLSVRRRQPVSVKTDALGVASTRPTTAWAISCSA
jgi:hypothetical protein